MRIKLGERTRFGSCACGRARSRVRAWPGMFAGEETEWRAEMQISGEDVLARIRSAEIPAMSAAKVLELE